jgi:HlyD family secretion protein
MQLTTPTPKPVDWRRLLPLAAALITTACSGGIIPSGGEAGAALPTPPASLTATGFIEAEEVSVVSEASGRVAEVLADEADAVSAGDPVVVLDDALLLADRAQAEAAVTVAQANLADLLAGPTSDEVDSAQASIDEAQASLSGAQSASYQAWQTANNPRDIDVQISQAELESQNALSALNNAQVELDRIDYRLQFLNGQDEDDLDHTAIDYAQIERNALVAQLAAAQIEYDGSLRKLDALRAQQDRPLAQIARAQNASAQIPVAEARVSLAQAQYDLLIADPMPEQIAIAQAQIDLAQAQVALIDARLNQLSLVAPIDGVITTRAIAVGETAQPGVSLMTIANLQTLKLVVYIPATEVGYVQIGAPVTIKVDSYPNVEFPGVIVNIGREAEFTPQNVQTEEDRVNLVFAVEIRIENEDGRLKPGMPADAIIDVN